MCPLTPHILGTPDPKPTHELWSCGPTAAESSWALGLGANLLRLGWGEDGGPGSSTLEHPFPGVQAQGACRRVLDFSSSDPASAPTCPEDQSVTFAVILFPGQLGRQPSQDRSTPWGVSTGTTGSRKKFSNKLAPTLLFLLLYNCVCYIFIPYSFYAQYVSGTVQGVNDCVLLMKSKQVMGSIMVMDNSYAKCCAKIRHEYLMSLR